MDEFPHAISRRAAGVLLHPTSLPGPFGIGDMGPAAHAWVGALAKAGQAWWQVLPLQPPGPGDSPYSALSAFAGNPALVSPELLVQDGLIAAGDIAGVRLPEERVDYSAVNNFKNWLLARAWDAFAAGSAPALRAPFDQFCQANAAWLDDVALFLALKQAHGGGRWRGWPKPIARREATALTAARAEHAAAADGHRFQQFLFFRQWAALRSAAADQGVKVLGDAPIFVADDSADAWAHPELFLLGPEGEPAAVSGVPPDYFSETGQLWGNPLYDWAKQKATGYRWWVDRIRSLLGQVDVVRLDHFRGFAAAWHVPAGAETAKVGEWVPGPGQDLFDVLRRELGGLPLVAEDLGLITKEVEALRDEVGVAGMRVLQFAFAGGPDSPFLPHNYARHSVVYTGTHDNDTTVGWYGTLPEPEKKFLKSYAPHAAADPPGELVRMAWSSVADVAIAPLQDVLGLGTAARMNVPGVAGGNWSWRVTGDQVTQAAFDRLAEWTWMYGRQPQAPAK